MNQMVANLYVNKTGASSSTTQSNTNVQMDTSPKPEDEQQTKRKQSTEKSVKKVKRKKPTESTMSNDIDGRIDWSILFIPENVQLGPDVEYSTITFEDFAASDPFKEVRFHSKRI